MLYFERHKTNAIWCFNRHTQKLFCNMREIVQADSRLSMDRFIQSFSLVPVIVSPQWRSNFLISCSISAVMVSFASIFFSWSLTVKPRPELHTSIQTVRRVNDISWVSKSFNNIFLTKLLGLQHIFLFIQENNNFFAQLVNTFQSMTTWQP